MTETFGPYCGYRLDTDMPVAEHGSCGRPFDATEVGIFEADGPHEAEVGVIGEIRLRGPNVMRGICGRTRYETFDEEGFYRTRDLGVIDGDGYLWYHGRLDDMFKVKGATVFPAEVESALRAIDGVRQAFVTSLPGPDGAHAVGAMVVSASPPAEIAEAARRRLSAFKVPTRWYVTEAAAEVPVMATGKVDQASLRSLLEAKGQA